MSAALACARMQFVTYASEFGEYCLIEDDVAAGWRLNFPRGESARATISIRARRIGTASENVVAPDRPLKSLPEAVAAAAREIGAAVREYVATYRGSNDPRGNLVMEEVDRGPRMLFIGSIWSWNPTDGLASGFPVPHPSELQTSIDLLDEFALSEARAALDGVCDEAPLAWATRGP